MGCFYRAFNFACLITGICISLSGSTPCMAADQKKTLLLFHSGLESFDAAYMISLLVELERQITDHKIKIVNTRDLTIAQLKSQLEKSKNCVLTIGQPALETILATRDNTPIFSTLVSRTNLDILADTYSRLGSRVTGIYEEQSFNRQLFLSRAINPANNNILVILGRKTRYFLNDFHRISKRQSLKLSFDILKHQESPQQSFARMSVEDGFLVILNEQQQYSDQNLQLLLVASHNRNIPMIGNKASDSKTAALASIYTPFKTLAKEAASGLYKMCQSSEMPVAKYGEHYAITINSQIAEFLNYTSLNERHLAKQVLTLEKATKHPQENTNYE